MKILLALMVLITFSFANYTIYYSGLKLGIIQTLNSIDENYLYVKVTNPIAKLLLGKKELIFYNDAYKKPKENRQIKYKRDRYHIIEIIRQSIENRLDNGTIQINNEKYIEIKKEKDYKFKYISKGKLKSNGTIKVENRVLISLIDEKNHVKIIKN